MSRTDTYSFKLPDLGEGVDFEDGTLIPCKYCGEETVNIVTKATHASSDYVCVDKGRVIAYNSDSSWDADSPTARFVCDSCERTWKVNLPIVWEWHD